ncbi:protein of unknown function DUF1826 [Thiorhodococcus drewsii AZ1]|uniref:DUF1826 domain-containing protein n=1 Tax=Thiorhodococcus drewsii AZ1 TaxID=765913 RepID=G2E0L6_9GAMM|nr:DUF1826 domain-containing protein [Thiorhodococcus drewsii]EGV31638.1 protein of unknown function DUF1826 [Thiorhodococcus drewsii AZ1]
MESLIAADMTTESPTWRRVTQLVDLAEVYDPVVQVCAWPREMDPDVSQYLAGLESTARVQAIETLSAAGRPQLNALPAGPGRDALIDDLSRLSEVLCDLVECPAVGLRLARVDHAMCPGWHIDRVGMRLICTYQGPGTQWLEDQDVDRRDLRHARMGDAAFIQAAPGEVVLLKGALWPGNEALGAVHRSPGIAPGADTRTLVTLDPLWHD